MGTSAIIFFSLSVANAAYKQEQSDAIALRELYPKNSHSRDEQLAPRTKKRVLGIVGSRHLATSITTIPRRMPSGGLSIVSSRRPRSADTLPLAHLPIYCVSAYAVCVNALRIIFLLAEFDPIQYKSNITFNLIFCYLESHQRCLRVE